VTALTFAGFGLASGAAAANWWSRWQDHRPTEIWSKPLVMVGLIVAACTLDPGDEAVRAWFVVALAWCLVGDVLLLGHDRWFVAGLTAFLIGHVAYVTGFVVADAWRWWAFIGAAVGLGVVASTVGRRIGAGAAARDPVLRVPVTAYLAVISLMVAAAAAAGDGWAIAGAVLFLGSDSVLGWRQFVAARPWMPVAIMVTYHAAQASLVVSLLG
jgi:uncharacterized membrane protein YhhN